MEITGETVDGPAPRPRMSARRKQGAVLRLLRGEPIEVVSRELSVTAVELSASRDAFLAAGEASLKTRPAAARHADAVVNWDQGLSTALGGVFRSAEDAVASFVTSGRLDFQGWPTASWPTSTGSASARRSSGRAPGRSAVWASGGLFGGSMLSGIFHAGGLVGAPAPRRVVPAACCSRPGPWAASVGSDRNRTQTVIATVRAIHQISDPPCAHRSRPPEGPRQAGDLPARRVALEA